MFLFRIRKTKSHHRNSFEKRNRRSSFTSIDQSCKEDTLLHRRIKRMEQFKNCCKKFTSFFFSRVGLCFVVVGYVVVGGFIFQRIEGKDELTENFEIHSKTDSLIYEIWNMSKYEILFHEVNFTHKIRDKVNLYQRHLVDAIQKGYKGEDGQIEGKWTYPGSILYSVTIITTIGYGHITCKTATGKIVTILYAIIGIPMMLLCLANIGTSMANTFRFCYSKICCGYCNYVKRRQMRLKTVATLNNGQAIATYSTLANYNQIIKSNSPNAVLNEKLEKQIITSEKSNLSYIVSNNNKIEAENNSTCSNKQPYIAAIDKSNNLMDIVDDNRSFDYRKITVPISVTLFILSSYIILGASLFSAWEGWTFLEGAYFCFITLSTIGLGDYVPGNSIKETQAEEKLVLCSFYLLMGLSLIAMCFNLMQEEVTAKFRRLAVRLGIIEDPNYW